MSDRSKSSSEERKIKPDLDAEEDPILQENELEDNEGSSESQFWEKYYEDQKDSPRHRGLKKSKKKGKFRDTDID